MTPKTEAAILGEQIISKSGEIEVSACIAGLNSAAPFTMERERRELRELVARLIALATSEPRLTPVGCGDGNTYMVSERPLVRDSLCYVNPAPHAAVPMVPTSPTITVQIGGKALESSVPPAPQAVGERLLLTDEQIVKAARVLNDRASAECGVDKDDMWKTYGESYLADVIAIEAALKEPT